LPDGLSAQNVLTGVVRMVFAVEEHDAVMDVAVGGLVLAAEVT
jgi:hypothetical protein